MSGIALVLLVLLLFRDIDTVLWTFVPYCLESGTVLLISFFVHKFVQSC